ncbi:hypothetical protein [Actinokineospora inagensis]|uniref:hypothetical protein n=1 Tax=Actinokineospora inagensis TaxID=103730 RepID=UPI000416947E|nr:hypothetical protein [Actinokineospora inagensis]
MSNTPTAVLSGVHSGPDPSPGLGLARSLRLAWPRLRLEALDYSPRSTGLSAAEFDRVHVRPGWHTADPVALCAGLVSIVESAGAVFLPGLDLEAALLAEHGHPALLLPPPAAFDTVARPGAAVAALLGLAVPEHRFTTDVEDAADFAARHGWRVLVKGPRRGTVAVDTRPALAAAITRLRRTWGDAEVLLQRRVDGPTESIVFAALDGDLLGACAMRPTTTTAAGLPWAGSLHPLDSTSGIDDLVRVTRWTGGGEVEIVRETTTGTPHLVAVNPRFPAWIHGATLAGVNLPARLVAAVTGIPPHSREKAHSTGFVRVVEEIPAGPHAIGVTPQARRAFASPDHDPSGMPALSRALATPRPRPGPTELEPPLAQDIPAALVVDPFESPATVFFGGVLDRGLDLLDGVCRDVEDATGVTARFAYPVRVNPDPRVLGAVSRRGAMVEVFSQAEARRSAAAGFPADRVALGGPAKWWRYDGEPVKFGVVTCDSVTDLERTVDLVDRGLVHADVLGLGLDPASRHGVDVTDPRTYRRVADLLRSAQIGRLGLRSPAAGPRLREFTAAITMAADLCARADVRVRCVDLGGGWLPGLDRGDLGGHLVRATRLAVRELGCLDQVLFEPGEFLVGQATAVFSTVLDVRDGPAGRAAVVDAAELPDHATHVLWRGPGGRWLRLPPGDDPVLDRLGADHGTRRTLPDDLDAGDHLLVLPGRGHRVD